MLNLTVTELQAIVGRQLARDAWVLDMQERGKDVALYRDYADGEHDAKLTSDMKKLLRIARDGNEFAGNYCDTIVQTMADRLVVEGVVADNEAASKWAADLLEAVRFDGLQMDVHEATLVDGDTYVMVQYNSDSERVEIAHEPAWDGSEGVLVIYDRKGRNIECAIKVWYESDALGNDRARVNVYYADHVDKYAMGMVGASSGPLVNGASAGSMQLLERVAWVDARGVPLGVPIVHFRNRASRSRVYGVSELKTAVPLQDAFNRTLVSMVMTGELSAFQIRTAKGFQPPSGITPGMFITIPMPTADTPSEAASLLNAMEVGAIEQASLVPFIAQAEFLVAQIATITRTPIPELMGSSNQSGEALKERQVALLGKVRKFQVKAGNGWEDVMGVAHRVATAFGRELPPAAGVWRCVWQDAELRNERDVVANALAVRDVIGDAEVMRLLMPVYGWTQGDIERIEGQKRQQQQTQLEAIGGLLPSFSTNEFEPAI